MNWNEMSTKYQNFETAFSLGSGGCRQFCPCGRTYYNPSDEWTWEEGEIEKLEKDPDAIALPHTVTMIKFEGKEYVADCDCWIKRAEQIMAFIDSHAQPIARYLTLEKKRLQKIADSAPTVR